VGQHDSNLVWENDDESGRGYDALRGTGVRDGEDRTEREQDVPGSESSVKDIPDVNDIETTQMSLPVNDNT